jgi:hypothetical protein
MVMIAWPPALTSGGAVRFPPKEFRSARFSDTSHLPITFVLRSAEQFTPKAQATFFRSVFFVPSGMEPLSASTSSATVEKIGPSSEANVSSPQDCKCRSMGRGYRSSKEKARSLNVKS